MCNTSQKLIHYIHLGIVKSSRALSLQCSANLKPHTAILHLAEATAKEPADAFYEYWSVRHSTLNFNGCSEGVNCFFNHMLLICFSQISHSNALKLLLFFLGKKYAVWNEPQICGTINQELAVRLTEVVLF